jgi:uncharacterized protein (TIGR02391 family)
MSLESYIKPDLWSAIKSSYTTDNYSHAIRDAMSFVTSVIRDKSGLDGDGQELVGQALGSGRNNQPRLMINRFQTQTEKDMQRGLMFVLKGMYALIRNPRVHERTEDTKEDADTIIKFIDYLTEYLGASQQSFTVQGFIEMIVDPFFVRDNEYIEELIRKIPIRKRTDTLIRIYRSLDWSCSDNMSAVIKKLIPLLNETELEELLGVVSDDLQKAEGPNDVTLIIKMLPANLWPKLGKMPRLRAESMLLSELKESWYLSDASLPESERTNKPASTWIRRIAEYYLRKDKLREVILDLLADENFDKHNFIARYFLRRRALEVVFEKDTQIQDCARAIASTLARGNAYMKKKVKDYLIYDPPDRWREILVEKMQPFTDNESPEMYTHMGEPVFGAFEEKPNPISKDVDDIPF